MPTLAGTMLRGCAALLALVLSTLAGPRQAASSLAGPEPEDRPAAVRGLQEQVDRQVAPTDREPVQAGPWVSEPPRPQHVGLSAPSPRLGSALGPRAP